MKLGLLAASLVLVVGGAVSCGGDGDGGGGHDAPTAKEFCGALKEFQTRYASSDPTKDLEGYIKTIKDSAARLDELGTPDDIPADARAGFDITVKKIKGLSDGATVDDLAHLGDVSDADRKKLDAFGDFVTKTCPDLSPETSG